MCICKTSPTIFKNHQIIVRTDYPIANFLRKLELVGRMVAWLVEFSEFGIRYESKGTIKSQSLADFIIQQQHLSKKHEFYMLMDRQRRKEVKQELY